MNCFNKGLTGTIPAALGELSALTKLDLEKNRLTGPIPPDLAKLTALENLHLSFNWLTGCVPRGIGLCASGIEYENGCSITSHGKNPKITGRCPTDEL